MHLRPRLEPHCGDARDAAASSAETAIAQHSAGGRGLGIAVWLSERCTRQERKHSPATIPRFLCRVRRWPAPEPVMSPAIMLLQAQPVSADPTCRGRRRAHISGSSAGQLGGGSNSAWQYCPRNLFCSAGLRICIRLSRGSGCKLCRTLRRHRSAALWRQPGYCMGAPHYAAPAGQGHSSGSSHAMHSGGGGHNR